MWFGLLGPLCVSHEGTDILVPAAKQRVLLAALLVRFGRVVPSAELAETVWDGTPPARAHVTLRSYVARLRQVLGPVAGARIVTRAPGYLINATEDEVDFARLAALWRTGGAAIRANAWQQASDMLAEALSLWRGAALEDVASTALRNSEVPRMEQLRLQATEWRIEADLHLGHAARLVPELQVLVAENPLTERFHLQLMLALAGSGRQADALAAYRRARRELVDELGMEPGPELQAVHQRILAGDAELARAVLSTECASPRQLPVGTSDFVGRSAELATLTALLRDGMLEARAVVISAIGGTPGIGKTALAMHWASRIADQFPDGQLYVNLRGFGPSGTPTSPSAAVRGFLEALGVSPDRIPVGLDAQAGLYRSLVAGRRMLVVLDNASDAGQVRPLLPGTPGCLALVTSRRRLAGLVVAEGAHLLDLHTLTEAESRELLRRRMGDKPLEKEPEAVAELIRLCAGLPLALAIAAARVVSSPHMALSALAAEMRDERNRLDGLDVGESVTSARAVFSWSYQDLSEPAARMFRLLGAHPGPDISTPAAGSLAGLPLPQASKALRELTDAHLVGENVPGRFELHDLLRVYASEQAETADHEAGCVAAINRVADHYQHTAYAANRLVYPAREPIVLDEPRSGVILQQLTSQGEAVAWFEAEHQALLAMVSKLAETGCHSHAIRIPWTMVDFLDRRGHWGEIITTQTAALTAAQQLRDDAEQARAHRLLGRTYIRIGSWDRGHEHLKKALDLHCQRGDRIGQATAHLSLARACELQDRYREALKHNLSALSLYRAAGSRSGEANSLNSVGWQHAKLGHHREALSYCQKALFLHRELSDKPGEAATWDSLGYIRHQMGNHGQAIDCYQHALEIYEEGGHRYYQADTFTHVADVKQAAGDLDAARDAWQRALAILDDLGHPDAERVRGKLG